MKKAPYNNGTLPMFAPKNTWKAPNMADLPDWSRATRLALDTEFKDKTLRELGCGARRGAKLAGVSFKLDGDSRAYYLPLRHPGGNNVPLETGIRYLQDNAHRFKGDVVGANMSGDLDILHTTEDIKFQQHQVVYKDIQVAGPLIWELHFKYSLEAEAARHGFQGKDAAALRAAAVEYGAEVYHRTGKNKGKETSTWKAIIPDLPSEHVGEYAEHDAAILLPLLDAQEKIIRAKNLTRVWSVECSLLPVLLKIRQRGVRIDFDQLDRIEQWAASEERAAVAEIRRMTGVNIGFNNCMQAGACAMALQAVGVQLYRTESGQWSVTTAILAAITHPVAAQIRYCRQVYKLRRTFVASIRKYETNGRIHGTLRQIVGNNEKNEKSGAAFGRLSHCIAKGTLIEVVRDVSKYPKGVPIEDVRAGDLAYTYDDNLKLCLRKVQWSGKVGTKKVIRVHWRGTGRKHQGHVDLTPDHRVRMTDGSYLRADALQPGYCVMALSRGVGSRYQIIRVEVLGTEVDVYDLTIDDTHNFIAGEVCVHNCHPNTAQQPSMAKFAQMWRKIWLPEPGALWAVNDLSQQEPRWTTHFAARYGCEGAALAAKAYNEDPRIDNHTFMANLTGLERKWAKFVFLALCYGEGGKKLCQHQLKLPTRWRVTLGSYKTGTEERFFDTEDQAVAFRKSRTGRARILEVAGAEGQRILDTFTERAPYIKQLSDLVMQKAEEHGHLRILGGRQLNFSMDKYGAYEHTYKALNRLIQGTSGYQLKLAMIRIDRDLPHHWMQMSRHDDIAGSVASVGEAKQVGHIMANIVKALVPFRVDTEVGTSDGDIHQICANEACHEHAVKDEIGKYYCDTHREAA